MKFRVVVVYILLMLCVIFIVLRSYNSLSHEGVFSGQYNFYYERQRYVFLEIDHVTSFHLFVSTPKLCNPNFCNTYRNTSIPLNASTIQICFILNRLQTMCESSSLVVEQGLTFMLPSFFATFATKGG